MYEVDERDRVVEINDVPQSSPGAPMPCVIGDHRRVVLAYFVNQTEIWQMSKEQLVANQDFREEIAVVRFNLCTAHMFGPPSDEALLGHPLSKRGLQPYGVFRIEDSSWLRQFERMNRVHPRHNPDRYWKKQHLIFAFHDSTFECICDNFKVTKTHGSISAVACEAFQSEGY